MESSIKINGSEPKNTFSNNQEEDVYFRNKNRVIFQGWKRYVEAEEEE